MNWAEQLATKDWNTKRTEILIRDNFKCQHPGCLAVPDRLEVHHLDYVGHWMAWEYPNNWLITLCHDHHTAHHKNKDIVEKKLLRTLQTKGFLMSDLLAMSAYFETNGAYAQSLLKTLRDFQNG